MELSITIMRNEMMATLMMEMDEALLESQNIAQTESKITTMKSEMTATLIMEMAEVRYEL